MKEPSRTIHKSLCIQRNVLALNKIDYGSFITIHNPLKQLPAKKSIIPEARFRSICYKELIEYNL